jgi:hypothetical protein
LSEQEQQAKNLAASASVIAARAAIFAATLAAVAVAICATGARAAPIVLIPHRAIYNLSLARVRSGSTVAAVRGHILYDFSGNTCKGYTVEFRQRSELYYGDGRTTFNDVRTVTWEAANAASFKFASENFANSKVARTVEGHAEREGNRTVVTLDAPVHQTLDLGANVVFPTEQTVRVIAAARAGKTILNFPVFDGSEGGTKVFDTLSVIGRRIKSDLRKSDPAAAGFPELAGDPRWPVTISYFARNSAARSGEQMPNYIIGFDLYDNGISRALSLDYSNFVVAGRLASLKIGKIKPCR